MKSRDNLSAPTPLLRNTDGLACVKEYCGNLLTMEGSRNSQQITSSYLLAMTFFNSVIARNLKVGLCAEAFRGNLLTMDGSPKKLADCHVVPPRNDV